MHTSKSPLDTRLAESSHHAKLLPALVVTTKAFGGPNAAGPALSQYSSLAEQQLLFLVVLGERDDAGVFSHVLAHGGLEAELFLGAAVLVDDGTRGHGVKDLQSFLAAAAGYRVVYARFAELDALGGGQEEVPAEEREEEVQVRGGCTVFADQRA